MMVTDRLNAFEMYMLLALKTLGFCYRLRVPSGLFRTLSTTIRRTTIRRMFNFLELELVISGK